MSSFLDAAQAVKEEEEKEGVGFGIRASGIHPWPVGDLNLQIFPVKSAKERAHILTSHSVRGTLMNKTPPTVPFQELIVNIYDIYYMCAKGYQLNLVIN